MTSIEIQIDEEVAALLRLESHRVSQMLDVLRQSGVPSKFVEFHQEVEARLSYLALGLEQGWIGDVRGTQSFEVDLTDYDMVAGE